MMTNILARKILWIKRFASPRRMKARNIMLYASLSIVSCMMFICMFFWDHMAHHKEPELSFVGRKGIQFMLDGKQFYVNGWNSFWLLDQAVENSGKQKVSEIFQTGAQMGLTVCRTWAFNDGANHALQVSLGIMDDRVFEALDWVIVEARKHGIRLLLSLVNNLQDYGGKTQYVKWAQEDGFGLSSSDDSFFFDPSIRSYFKIYIKNILTRKNHITGVEYRNDPTIFAWELMNAPQCASDESGDTIQEWIEEMAEYTKTIDKKHLLTIGLEGFYGSWSPLDKKTVNPGKKYDTLGSDFVRNSKFPAIDFSTVHIRPDKWYSKEEFTEKINHISKWMASHIEDGEKELNKPILFTEFGLANKAKNFKHWHRVLVFKTVFDIIYESAKKQGAGAGAIFQQFLVSGMEQYDDDYGIVPRTKYDLDELIKEQSCRLIALQYGKMLSKRSSSVC